MEDVKLATTTLLTEDGVKIIVPNKHIVGEILYNSKMNRMVEGLVGISYGNNPEQAIELIRKSLSQFSEVAEKPHPQIGIQGFGDSSINIAFRYWVPTVKYYHSAYAVNLAVYKALQAAKIEIPFPQREVRILSGSSPS